MTTMALLQLQGPPWLPYALGAALLLLGAHRGRVFHLPQPPGALPTWPARLRRAVGALVMGFGLFLLATGGGRPSDSADWETDFARGLAQAEQRGGPVVVDGWNRYCAACKSIWEGTLRHPEVIPAIAPYTRLKLDLAVPENKAMFERWGVRELPFVALFDSAAALREGRYRDLTAAAHSPARFLAALGGADAAAPDVGRDLASRGLLVTLLLVFLAGLAVSLTPCVLPVYILTVGLIGARQLPSIWARFRISAVYVLGLVLTYSVLGVLAGLGSVSMGVAFQSPVVLAALAALFALIAAFYLELLRLPQAGALAARITATTRSNALTALLLGATVGLIAAPCVGPMLLGILSFIGTQRDVALGFALMLSFALGMGTLFLALGTSTALLERLRRAGPWGYRLEMLFAVAFLALAFHYLSLL